MKKLNIKQKQMSFEKICANYNQIIKKTKDWMARRDRYGDND